MGGTDTSSPAEPASIWTLSSGDGKAEQNMHIMCITQPRCVQKIQSESLSVLYKIQNDPIMSLSCKTD